MHPLYILSKGRPTTATSLDLFRQIGGALVIEAQEKDAYAAAAKGYEVLTLPERDKGIAYVRQHVLRMARARGQKAIWVADDDLTHFMDGEREIPAREAMRRVENMVNEEPRIGLAGFSKRQVAKKPSWNEGVYAMFLINATVRVDYDYDPQNNPTGMRTDTDFCLQMLTAGMLTYESEIGLFMPTDGKAKGGLYQEYQSHRVNTAETWLRNKWPELVYPIEPDNAMGNLRSGIRWEKFKRRHNKGRKILRGLRRLVFLKYQSDS